MFVKRLFYVSASILCLAAAYALGASTANAQKSTPPEVAAGWLGYYSGSYVVMTNGDTYHQAVGSPTAAWQRVGNVLTP